MELYAVVKIHKHPIKYLTVQIAEAAGQVVIGTPVHHRILNVIERNMDSSLRLHRCK